MMYGSFNYRSTGSPKFSGDLITERLYQYTLACGHDAELGESDSFGWLALFRFGSDDEFRVFTGGAAGSILMVGSQGFVYRTDYATRAELDAEWEQFESEWDSYQDDDEDDDDPFDVAAREHDMNEGTPAYFSEPSYGA